MNFALDQYIQTGPYTTPPGNRLGRTLQTLEAITAGELEALRGTYNAPCSRLTNLERLAIVRAIENELTDRAGAVKSSFACDTEIDRLQALLEEQQDLIFYLRMQIDELEEELETAKKPTQSVSGGDGKGQ
jgi:hypothetical protein